MKNTGSARVPTSFKTKAGFALGSWASSQRRSMKSLSTDQRKLLESCKGWSWDRAADQWNAAFEQLEQYVEENGSARVPQRFKTKSGFHLGSWVNKQRINRDLLSTERKKRLEAIQGWQWDLRIDHWDRGFSHLLEYVKQNGSARVPIAFKTDGSFALGTWVTRQRVRRDVLLNGRQKLLESCEGWSWDPVADQWEKGFARLQEYMKNTSTTRVPKRFRNKDGFALGIWICRQRNQKNFLSAERRRLLESCTGWCWSAIEEQWEEGFEQLERYIKVNGTARVPQRFKTIDGYALGQWVATQRKMRDAQSAERKKRLGRLRGWAWDARS
jgi:hypothetical protein